MTMLASPSARRAALVAPLAAALLLPATLFAQDWTWSGTVARGN